MKTAIGLFAIITFLIALDPLLVRTEAFAAGAGCAARCDAWCAKNAKYKTPAACSAWCQANHCG